MNLGLGAPPVNARQVAIAMKFADLIALLSAGSGVPVEAKDD